MRNCGARDENNDVCGVTFTCGYCRQADNLAELLEAAKSAHEAIDLLFTWLVEDGRRLGVPFFPSKSGRPYVALMRIVEVIKRLDPSWVYGPSNKALGDGE